MYHWMLTTTLPSAFDIIALGNSRVYFRIQTVVSEEEDRRTAVEIVSIPSNAKGVDIPERRYV